MADSWDSSLQAVTMWAKPFNVHTDAYSRKFYKNGTCNTPGATWRLVSPSSARAGKELGIRPDRVEDIPDLLARYYRTVAYYEDAVEQSKATTRAYLPYFKGRVRYSNYILTPKGLFVSSLVSPGLDSVQAHPSADNLTDLELLALVGSPSACAGKDWLRACRSRQRSATRKRRVWAILWRSMLRCLAVEEEVRVVRVQVNDTIFLLGRVSRESPKRGVTWTLLSMHRVADEGVFVQELVLT